MGSLRLRLCLLPLALGVLCGFGRERATGQTVAYALLAGSDLTDDCLICDRVSLPVPLQGNFQLQLLETTPLVSRYQLTNIQFHTTGTNGLAYSVQGSGSYQVGGEVALQQELTLNVQIDNGFTNSSCVLTNAQPQVTKPITARGGAGPGVAECECPSRNRNRSVEVGVVRPSGGSGACQLR
jgi:hypothetical protein